MSSTRLLSRPGPIARGTYGLLRGLVWTVARVYWRIEVIGAERIPTNGGFVFAPTHRSNIDFLLPALATRRRIRWMAKHTIFTGGFVDWFLTQMGAFPVNRDVVDRAALDACERLIEAGQGVVMFPEGRRKDGPLVEEVFHGPAFVAARRRVPIVPMGIGGSDGAMPIGRKMIRPHKVVLVVGEPIYPDVPLEGRVSRSAVDDLTARLTVDLQRLYDDARRLV